MPETYSISGAGPCRRPAAGIGERAAPLGAALDERSGDGGEGERDGEDDRQVERAGDDGAGGGSACRSRVQPQGGCQASDRAQVSGERTHDLPRESPGDDGYASGRA
jgi:hypothetical protein